MRFDEISGSDFADFTYGADLMRYRQMRSDGTRIYYLDKLMEIERYGMAVNYRHYLGDVAVLTKTGSLNDASPGISYLFRDRLGSVSAVGNTSGVVFEFRAYDPYGRPRNGNWTDKSQPTLNSSTTDRGFTDHEHLDDWQLIHMNGRGFDYNAGRFLSVDPVIQAPGNSQSINGFAYIMNNPFSGTDPTGYLGRSKYMSRQEKNATGTRVGAQSMSFQGAVFRPRQSNNGAETTQQVTGQGATVGTSDHEDTNSRNNTATGTESGSGSGNMTQEDLDELLGGAADINAYEKEAHERSANAMDKIGDALELATPVPPVLKLTKWEKFKRFFGLGKRDAAYYQVVNQTDPAADAIALRLGGTSRVTFPGRFDDREFDAITDLYLVQTKGPLRGFGKKWRDQTKATFEAASELGRTPYFHFNGEPDASIIRKLAEYADRYGVEPVIDVAPL